VKKKRSERDPNMLMTSNIDIVAKTKHNPCVYPYLSMYVCEQTIQRKRCSKFEQDCFRTPVTDVIITRLPYMYNDIYLPDLSIRMHKPYCKQI
jgi:hypothetical protein